MRIGSKEVILCQRPAFMGCEENVFPMLVFESKSIGKAEHCLDPSFELNDLAHTGFLGLRGGLDGRFSFDKIFHVYGLKEIEEVKQIMQSYGQGYAFFFEKSHRPLEEGYIYRCRFVREDVFPELYPQSVNKCEISQSSLAIDILYAFFDSLDDHSMHKYLRDIYGDYYDSRYFRDKYGDEEQFYFGSAVWEEKDGIFRAWKRVIYMPK